MGICEIKQLLDGLFILFFIINADEMRTSSFYFLICPKPKVHLCRNGMPISLCVVENLLALASIWLHLISYPLAHVSAVVCSTALPDVSKNVHGLQKTSGLYVLTNHIFQTLSHAFFFRSLAGV